MARGEAWPRHLWWFGLGPEARLHTAGPHRSASTPPRTGDPSGPPAEADAQAPRPGRLPQRSVTKPWPRPRPRHSKTKLEKPVRRRKLATPKHRFCQSNRHHVWTWKRKVLREEGHDQVCQGWSPVPSWSCGQVPQEGPLRRCVGALILVLYVWIAWMPRGCPPWWYRA